jgi:hypothetical protein
MSATVRPPCSPPSTLKAGMIVEKCMPRHRAREFRKFLDEVERNIPTNLDIHIVMDSASSHKTKLIRAWFAKRQRWQVISRRHLRLGSIGSSVFSRSCQNSRSSVGTSIDCRAGEGHQRLHWARNADPKPFRWTKSADDILASVGRFCRRTLVNQAATV